MLQWLRYKGNIKRVGRSDLGAKKLPKMDHFSDITFFYLTNFGLFLPISGQIQHTLDLFCVP